MEGILLWTSFILLSIIMNAMNAQYLPCGTDSILPNNCTCGQATYVRHPTGEMLWFHLAVTCDTIGLTRIPQNLPNITTELTIRENSIPTVSRVNYTHLKTLHLVSSKIHTIESKAFQNLSKLLHLSLVDNLITRLSRGMFIGLKSLRVLVIAGNHIPHIGGFTFIKADMPFLNTIAMVNNSIETIHDHAFVNLTHVERIHLDVNRLTHVPSRCLRSLINVQLIGLTNNSITSIRVDTFDGFHNVTVLNLAGNNLVEIPEGSFNGLPQLQSLNLSSCNLQSFDLNLTLLRNLSRLSLSGNRLRTLSEESADWRQLSVFQLVDNPWSCDCALLWMKSFNRTQRDLVCAAPSSLKGQPLADISADELICANSLQVSSGVQIFDIILGLLVTFIVVIALILLVSHLIKKSPPNCLSPKVSHEMSMQRPLVANGEYSVPVET